MADWIQEVTDSFKAFGYTPTQAEINAFVPLEEGGAQGQITAQSAIANYVQAHQQLSGAQSQIQGNLLSEQQAQQMSTNLGNILETQGQAAYQQASQIFTQAPQLFGSMTSDQVSQYLAPLQTQFQQTLGQVEGAAAQRGLAGSSLEANAMAQAQQQFQQNVLSQGLGIGMQQQQNQAGVLQGLGGQQFSAGQQQYGLGTQYAGLANQSAGQNYQAASDLAGLSGQTANQALAQQAALKALNPTSSSPLGGIVGTALGAGLGAFGGPVGAGIGANLGGQIGSAVTGNPTGANLGGAVSNPLMLYSLLKGGGGGAGGGLFGGGSTPNYTGGLATPPMGPVGSGGPGSTLLPGQLSLQ